MPPFVPPWTLPTRRGEMVVPRYAPLLYYGMAFNKADKATKALLALLALELGGEIASAQGLGRIAEVVHEAVRRFWQELVLYREWVPDPEGLGRWAEAERRTHDVAQMVEEVLPPIAESASEVALIREAVYQLGRLHGTYGGFDSVRIESLLRGISLAASREWQVRVAAATGFRGVEVPPMEVDESITRVAVEEQPGALPTDLLLPPIPPGQYDVRDVTMHADGALTVYMPRLGRRVILSLYNYQVLDEVGRFCTYGYCATNPAMAFRSSVIEGTPWEKVRKTYDVHVIHDGGNWLFWSDGRFSTGIGMRNPLVRDRRTLSRDAAKLVSALRGSDTGRVHHPDGMVLVSRVARIVEESLVVVGASRRPYASKQVKRLDVEWTDGTRGELYEVSVGYSEGYEYDIYTVREDALAESGLQGPDDVSGPPCRVAPPQTAHTVLGPRPAPSRTHPWTVWLAWYPGSPMVTEPGQYGTQWKRFKDRRAAEQWLVQRLNEERAMPGGRWRCGATIGRSDEPAAWYHISPYTGMVRPIRVLPPGTSGLPPFGYEWTGEGQVQPGPAPQTLHQLTGTRNLAPWQYELYHGTSAELYDTIRREGLRAAPEWNRGRLGVFVWDDFESALNWANSWYGDNGMVVLIRPDHITDLREDLDPGNREYASRHYPTAPFVLRMLGATPQEIRTAREFRHPYIVGHDIPSEDLFFYAGEDYLEARREWRREVASEPSVVLYGPSSNFAEHSPRPGWAQSVPTTQGQHVS